MIGGTRRGGLDGSASPPRDTRPPGAQRRTPPSDTRTQGARYRAAITGSRRSVPRETAHRGRCGIHRDLFHQQFAADLPAEQAAVAAATQRPLRDVALDEGAAADPAWQHLPSWFLTPELDRNIPPQAQRFMAERAGAREVVELAGASHAVPASRPDDVADLVLRATKATT
ncbi:MULTISPECIES: alpha/beta fold hydrolase [unclassified Modestobacter]